MTEASGSFQASSVVYKESEQHHSSKIMHNILKPMWFSISFTYCCVTHCFKIWSLKITTILFVPDSEGQQFMLGSARWLFCISTRVTSAASATWQHPRCLSSGCSNTDAIDVVV